MLFFYLISYTLTQLLLVGCGCKGVGYVIFIISKSLIYVKLV